MIITFIICDVLNNFIVCRSAERALHFSAFYYLGHSKYCTIFIYYFHTFCMYIFLILEMGHNKFDDEVELSNEELSAGQKINLFETKLYSILNTCFYLNIK